MKIVLLEALDSYDEALLNFQRYLEPEKITTAGVKDWVSICPKVTSQGVSRAVIAQLTDLYKNSLLGNKTPAYDGRKDLYPAGHSPIETNEFVIKLVDRDVDTKSVRYVVRGRSFNEGSSSGVGSGAKPPNLLSQLGQSKDKWPMWLFCALGFPWSLSC